MALFKIFNNIDSQNTTLPSTYTKGYMYYDAKESIFYIDTAGEGGTTGARQKINAWGAEKTLKDSLNQQIDTTYIKGISISNNQLSYITGDGTSYTVEGTLGAVTGVKGNAESTYRTGQINLTPANIGAATSGHTHTTTIATDNGTNQLTLAFGTKYKLTAGGTNYIFTMPANPDTNTASAADDILHGSNNGTEITYAPYTTRQSILSFDTTTTNPDGTGRLNLNGHLYATKLYSDGKEVLTAHQSLTNYKTKQTEVSTATAETTTATRFVYSITQNDNGEITVKTRPLPIYNNYTLPKATDSVLGGIKTGYSASGKKYAIKVDDNGNAYVSVPWTDTKVTQSNQTENGQYRILLSHGINDIEETDTINKSGNLTFNPSTKLLSVGGDILATGNLTITGNTNLNNETYADSLTAGSLLVTGNSNFTQIPTAPTPANSSNDTSIATTEFVKNSISSLSNAMHFIGKATVAITDGSTTDPAISGYSTKVAGDVVIDKDTFYEYVWTTENKWERLGPDGSYSLSTHTHGNISNDGKITSTATIDNGDKLVIVDVDSTAGSKLTSSSITFDGSTTTKALTQKGTWETFNNYTHPTGDGNLHVPATGTDNNGKFLKAGSTAGSLSWDNAVTSITLKAGDGVSLDTNNTAITTTGTRTISHAVPSGASATTLGNSTTRYYIKTITTDKFGHVTGVTTGNETVNSTSLTASQAVSTDASKNLVSTNLTVSDPLASGTGISYIASITQSAVGKITATKSTVRSASTSQTGVVQLNSAIDSTSETLAATSKAVKTAYDLANNHKYWANIEATSAASYNQAPEMASIKLNGNTSATVASTLNVNLVFNSITNALDFVFA